MKVDESLSKNVSTKYSKQFEKEILHENKYTIVKKLKYERHDQSQ